MDLHAILIRAPVNRLAAGVVSQRRAAGADAPLTREELLYLIDRLTRRHRLLKAVLGIRTKAQHSNLMYRYGKGIPQFRRAREPRAFAEYVTTGHQIQRLTQQVAELKRAARLEAA